MRKYALVAAVAALAIAVPLSIGSSHREAPLIALDPDRGQHRHLRVHGGRTRRAS